MIMKTLLATAFLIGTIYAASAGNIGTTTCKHYATVMSSNKIENRNEIKSYESFILLTFNGISYILRDEGMKALMPLDDNTLSIIRNTPAKERDLEETSNAQRFVIIKNTIVKYCKGDPRSTLAATIKQVYVDSLSEAIELSL
jgi:hypothetical protein